MDTDPTSNVSRWFGPDFQSLHPLLQRLHLQGGVLRGDAQVDIPPGFAGRVGTTLARSMGAPVVRGATGLVVTIRHERDTLHWDRRFANGPPMPSTFVAVGTRAAGGYWREVTGRLQMRLTVDIEDGAWHWRCLSIHLFGLRFPPWLFPGSRASKRVVEGGYVFAVEFTVPLLGVVYSYGGRLTADD